MKNDVKTADSHRLGHRVLQTALSAALLFGFSLPLHAATVIDKISGAVLITQAGQPAAVKAVNGAVLQPGANVQTQIRSECEIRFDDDTKLTLGSQSNFTLKGEAPAREMTLSLGTLRAKIKRMLDKPFNVRTPQAVAAVRGTDFRVTVDREGQSLFDLYEGLIGVGDSFGAERLLKPGERIQVDERGLGPVQTIAGALEGQRREVAQNLRKEVGLDLSKEAVLAAAAEEIKLAEYQAGKAIIDVFGKRVRLEQYIMRPGPDQFKLVVLNERSDRFDYFYYKGIFNKTLPADLNLALKDLGGKPLASPEWYLLGYETGRSNTADSVKELASGGHPVDVNHNPDPDDDVAQYFDSTRDRYVSLASGDAYYQTLFDDYSIEYNGLRTFAWTGTNIVSNKSVIKTYYGGVGNYVLETDFPDFPLLHQRIRESYGDGSVFVQYDNYMVSDEGKSAAVTDFAGITSGPAYKENLLKWNFQQVITSSLFNGGKIDLVVEPKTMIQSGLIQ